MGGWVGSVEEKRGGSNELLYALGGWVGGWVGGWGLPYLVVPCQPLEELSSVLDLVLGLVLVPPRLVRPYVDL